MTRQTSRALGQLALAFGGLAVVLFLVGTVTHTHHHGVAGALSDISWFGLLLSLLGLGCVAVVAAARVVIRRLSHG
jgi:hypothetical protein